MGNNKSVRGIAIIIIIVRRNEQTARALACSTIPTPPAPSFSPIRRVPPFAVAIIRRRRFARFERLKKRVQSFGGGARAASAAGSSGSGAATASGRGIGGGGEEVRRNERGCARATPSPPSAF